MEEIIKPVKESVSRVLKFYENVGTPLSYNPKLGYVDKICETKPDGLMKMKNEFKIIDKIVDFMTQNFAKTIWKDAYGLDVSDEALAELTKNIKHKINKTLIPQEFESGADILIFQPCKKYIKSEKAIDEIIAHEIWHLVEKERKLLEEHPFITEGTATYAMKRFIGKRCNKKFEKFDDFFMMIYLGAANIVQNYVENKENPYQSMLDTNLRREIEQDLVGRIKPILVEKCRKSLENEDVKKGVAFSMQKIPEFKELKGNLSTENIIRVYKNMGANKLADELEGKNLENLMDYFRMAGF